MGEQYGQIFTGLYGLETVSTRYFNVFGPRQDPSSPYSGVISVFIRAVIEGRAPTIHGDGEQTRDFTYVGNVVDGVLKACHAPGVAGEVMNVATAGRISLNDVFAALQRISGTSLTPIYGPERAGDVKHSQADISKARRLLHYEPLVSLERGLAETYTWYKAETAGR